MPDWKMADVDYEMASTAPWKAMKERLERIRRRREAKRGEVQQIECPVCFVAAGQVCIRNDGRPRRSNHAERMRKHQKLSKRE